MLLADAAPPNGTSHSIHVTVRFLSWPFPLCVRQRWSEKCAPGAVAVAETNTLAQGATNLRLANGTTAATLAQATAEEMLPCRRRV